MVNPKQIIFSCKGRGRDLETTLPVSAERGISVGSFPGQATHGSHLGRLRFGVRGKPSASGLPLCGLSFLFFTIRP